MPKMYRRSWEKQKTGRAGAISSPEARVSVTDGVISSASAASPVAIITSATGFGGTPTVGRKVRVTGTTGNGRYDGMYVVATGSTSGSLVLRCNHNYSLAGNATVDSPARFMENCTSITVTLLPSATFTLDVAGDMEEWLSGSYVYIEGATNIHNNGLWLISHRLTNQTAIISKSWFYTRIGCAGLKKYTDDLTTFVAESSLTYSVGDRDIITASDCYEWWIQALIDMGWTLHQERGPNATLGLMGDRILLSPGEDNSNYFAHNVGNNKKRMFLRCMFSDGGILNTGANQGLAGVSFAMFLNWDETLTNVSPGDGTAGMSLVNAYLFANPGGATAGYQPDMNMALDSGNWLTEGPGGFPHEQVRRSVAIFGDRDEFAVFSKRSGRGSQDSEQTNVMFIGPLKPVGNPNVMEVTAAVTAGSLVDINVGSINPAALTPPYAAGDNITICGYRSGGTKEYVETATIDSVFTPDAGTSYRIRVNALVQNYGSGSHEIKAQIGEDPYPVCFYRPWNSQHHWHNTTRLGNATGRDYDATNFGNICDSFQLTTVTELNPNRHTGRWGLVPVIFRYTTSGEYRGSYRYLWRSSDLLSFGSKLLDRSNNVFVSLGGIAIADHTVIGPMPKALAGVK